MPTRPITQRPIVQPTTRTPTSTEPNTARLAAQNAQLYVSSPTLPKKPPNAETRVRSS